MPVAWPASSSPPSDTVEVTATVQSMRPKGTPGASVGSGVGAGGEREPGCVVSAGEASAVSPCRAPVATGPHPPPAMPRPSRLRAAFPALAAALFAVGGAPAVAQPAPGLDPVLVEADSLVAAGNVAEGRALLEARLEARPDDWETLWRAARAATAGAVLAVGRPELRDRLLERAIELGDRAVALRPRGVEGIFWRLAPSGRLALHQQDPRRAAELARTVWAGSEAILEIDPDHPGAHNALGRLQYEILILPLWKRTLGRLVAGDAIGGASWEGAERHLARALELDPGQILYRRDLGELYLRRDRPDLARNLLEAAAGMRWRHPGDEVFKEEARALLRTLDAEEGAGGTRPR